MGVHLVRKDRGSGKAMIRDVDVYGCLRRIPRGRVATYGQIARALGCPGGARAVGRALHRNPDGDLNPCHRVVDAGGKLSGAYAFGGIREQAERLEKDGVEVRNGRVDLKEYGLDGIPPV